MNIFKSRIGINTILTKSKKFSLKNEYCYLITERKNVEIVMWIL